VNGLAGRLTGARHAARVGWLLVLTLLLAGSGGAGPTAASGESLALNPSSRSVQVGDVFTFALEVNTGTSSADTVGAYLDFNPAHLEVVKPDGSPATSVELNPAVGFDTVLANSVGAGQINLAVSKFGGPLLSGQFTVATIRFRAKAPVASTAVTLSQTLQRPSGLSSGGLSLNASLGHGTASIAAPGFDLSVIRVGAGSGTVTSTPGGITCGGDCLETFAGGTSVALAASPAAGSVFEGWAGDCAGTGSCVVTLDAARTVAASFRLSDTNPARLYLEPSTASIAPNQVVALALMADTGAGSADTVGAYLEFNRSLLQAVTAGGDPASEVEIDDAAGFTHRTLNTVGVGPNGSGQIDISVSRLSGPALSGRFKVATLRFKSLGPTPATAVRLLRAAPRDSGLALAGAALSTALGDGAISSRSGQHQLTVTRGGLGSGTVTSAPAGIACGADCTESYAVGTSVTLTASADSGSTFAGWSGECAAQSTCTVTMDAARTISATFNRAPGTRARLFLTPSTVAVPKNRTFSLDLMAESGPGSIDAVGAYLDFDVTLLQVVDATGQANSTISINPSAGFDNVLGQSVRTSGAAGEINIAVANLNSAPLSLSEPVRIATIHFRALSETSATNLAFARTTVRPSGLSLGGAALDVDLGASTVTIGPPFFTLTASTTGSGGGSVTSTPTGIACGDDCSEAYLPSTSVTLTATPDGTSTFTGWTGCPSASGASCTVPMSADTTVSAAFTRITHALTVSRTGSGSGGVTSAPSGIDCGEQCEASYVVGTEITLTASPGDGSRFGGWSGDCSGTAACTVTMSAARAVTATFIRQHALTVTRLGSGSGTVASTPSGINCGATCTASFNQDTPVSLVATPASGSRFVTWGGACSLSGVCEVTMSEARSVTATFEPAHTLTVSRLGTGSGTVTSDPAGIQCGNDCTEDYASGAIVQLTATANTTSVFTGWAGACASAGTGVCSVTMSAARSVTATFEPAVRLTLNRSGTGGGTVEINPGGILCPPDCSRVFRTGTQVTLTARPTSGSGFTRWTGACTGIEQDCSRTLNADTTVTAEFAATPCALPTARITRPLAGLQAQRKVRFGAATTVDSRCKSLTFRWDFGDPTITTDTSTSSGPTYTYRAAGTYAATLTVRDKAGQRASATITITVP
jgi:PKD repeat protein